LIKTDGYHQSGGKILFNAIASSVVNVSVGNMSVKYDDTSKAAHGVFEYVVVDKKSGKVIVYDMFKRDAKPSGKSVIRSNVKKLLLGLAKVRKPKKQDE
jgi:hypothetical protein